MTIGDIREIVESWAPPSIAWEKDNIGLEVGTASGRVRTVLLALDATDQVIEEARAEKADLIICHHPLLFHPLRTVNTEERTGRMLKNLLRYNIALLAAHTNLDFMSGGVSFALAESLGITETSVLSATAARREKIVTFVPRDHADGVRRAMALAGAGNIGQYSSCSFASGGTGTFEGSRDSTPFVGSAGRLEHAEEVRLEMVADSWNRARIVAALRQAHPYQEAAYDVYQLENSNSDVGAGAIGRLKKPVRLKQFLVEICSALKIRTVRYSGDLKASVATVAVCGGSGSDLLPVALERGADALVTADVRYHAFQEPDGRMALIDAGHYETEVPILGHLARMLGQHRRIEEAHIRIIVSRASRNPVQYFSS